MRDASTDHHRFAVLADHGQFRLQDLDAHAAWTRSHADSGAPAGWTEEP
ncbi:hypothetical protein ACFFR3_06875 [Nonomuraea salmonea]|uniref:Uncharacterized protein n=1 Tax=Nonomuraea salmonea TaxID=46181 RepID=A0ABV5NG42_9ACTN